MSFSIETIIIYSSLWNTPKHLSWLPAPFKKLRPFLCKVLLQLIAQSIDTDDSEAWIYPSSIHPIQIHFPFYPIYSGITMPAPLFQWILSASLSDSSLYSSIHSFHSPIRTHYSPFISKFLKKDQQTHTSLHIQNIIPAGENQPYNLINPPPRPKKSNIKDIWN